MLDQVFDSFRKASESSLQMQQDMFKQWAQQWPTAPLNAAGMSADWGRSFQKQWTELATEAMNKHRETLDTSYRSGIQVIEQACRLSEAKSPDEYRRLIEELWRKMFETFKAQSETQFKEFQKGAEKVYELSKKTPA